LRNGNLCEHLHGDPLLSIEMVAAASSAVAGEVPEASEGAVETSIQSHLGALTTKNLMEGKTHVI
jgi:hypothetical protein